MWPLFKDIGSDKWLAYRVFACIAVITMGISLLFDARDTVLWLLGDRGSVLVAS